MSDSGFSLIDLKGISEPLTKLVESVAKGIGVWYGPTAKVRNAKAQAKEMLILAEAHAQVDQLELRANERVASREMRRQRNIDSIMLGAASALPDVVSSADVDEDWIVSFFEHSQDVGSEEMQQIWSKILAGEIAQPGSFNLRTLQSVKTLTPQEARAFTKLCSFSFYIEGRDYILPILDHDFFVFIRGGGFTTDDETHLKNIGLLSHSDVWYQPDDEVKNLKRVSYFSRKYEFLLKDKKGHDLQTFPLTKTGSELAAISGAGPDDRYIELLIKNGHLTAV